MAEGSSGNELQRILEAIASSEIVENRIQLFTELGNIDFKGISDFAPLVDCLVYIKDDNHIEERRHAKLCEKALSKHFTCLDVTQCLLNKSILQVALKYVEFNLSSCLPQVLTLGIKASIWSGKHLNMTLLSIQESQEEEHSSVFFQLLKDVLRFSALTFSALMKFPSFDDKALMDTVENAIVEVFNLTRDSISNVKKTPLFGSEMLKVTHDVIDAIIKLCKLCSESVNWDIYKEKLSSLDKPDCVDHVIHMTKCAIEKLSQIGVVAAKDGGNSVNILNVSWKGVVSLLQIGGEYLAEEMNIANLVLTLLELVTVALKSAAEVWSSSLKETISVAEARRIFVPVKFYLINSVKISSLYPHQAYTVYREITLCALMIMNFRIAVSNDNLLKNACVVITELLEQTTLDLILSLISSSELKLDQKLEVLDWLFINVGDSHSNLGGPTLADCSLTSMNEIFSLSSEGMSRARTLIIGRVALFINFLRCSFGLDEDVKIGLTQKLQWFLDIIVEEDVYSNILVLQLPMLSGSVKAAEMVWQSMFTSLLHAFKTFMIVISSSTAWVDLESFLLENLFHPHFLCWEIVMECLCFMLRHAGTEMENNIISKLCSLLKLLASSESVFLHYSSLRKLARSICFLLNYGGQSMVNQVYVSLVGDARSQLSSILCLALFIEGFPFNLLTDKLRNTAVKSILSDYIDFIDNFDEASLVSCTSGLFGIPVFILCASLQSLQASVSDIDAKILKFLVSVTHNYSGTEDKAMKHHYLRLLGEILGIISSLKHLYASNDIEEAILGIKNIFISEPAANDDLSYQCKPHLAHFMAGLIHMEMSESDNDAKSCAVWELYHILLKERHWAFIHLAITAFGYFAARTKCNQLWRFVPQDAALSYDIVSGVEASKDRFMLEFKTFLEKEMAIRTVAPSPEQLELLLREGFMLKEMVRKISDVSEAGVGCENMEVDEKNQSNKRRKLPEGIGRGVEMLKSGLKIIGDGISQWQHNQLETNELRIKFLTQFSQLEDLVTHFEGLAGCSDVCFSDLIQNTP